MTVKFNKLFYGCDFNTNLRDTSRKFKIHERLETNVSIYDIIYNDELFDLKDSTDFSLKEFLEKFKEKNIKSISLLEDILAKSSIELFIGEYNKNIYFIRDETDEEFEVRKEHFSKIAENKKRANKGAITKAMNLLAKNGYSVTKVEK